ncbi:MAG: CapA family protein [Prevotellaceae bacterium]|jgi:poly-gamma-glutamate synthesis protein (capsule biosynthesis protein)|nr:CapA family protein [Prevotellaceae bacterium]
MKTHFNTFLFLALVFYSNTCISQRDTITLLFAGDIMQHMPQINSAYENGVYNYEPCFRYIKNEVGKADISIGNLEVPLAGKPYSGYPQFSAPDDIAFALKDAGFDVLVTANNHSCDKQAKGIKGTITILDSAKIQHTGIFSDITERENKYPLIIESKNFRFALLNYTYGTNGLAIPKPYVVNLIDTAQIIKDIEKARSLSPDMIIAFMHWGEEYKHLSNNNQKELAEFLIKQGVSLIIGAHSHVIQPMEKRYATNGMTNAAIVYSLGNFVSNQSQPNTDGGAMVRIKLIKDSIGTRIQNCTYSLVWVYKPVENNKRKYFILPAANYEKNSDLMETNNHLKLKTFLKNSRELLNSHNVGFNEYKF